MRVGMIQSRQRGGGVGDTEAQAGEGGGLQQGCNSGPWWQQSLKSRSGMGEADGVEAQEPNGWNGDGGEAGWLALEP